MTTWHLLTRGFVGSPGLLLKLYPGGSEPLKVSVLARCPAGKMATLQHKGCPAVSGWFRGHLARLLTEAAGLRPSGLSNSSS